MKGATEPKWPPFNPTINRILLGKLKKKVPGLISSDDIKTGVDGLTIARPFLLGNDDRISDPRFMKGFRGLINLDRKEAGGTHWVRLDVLGDRLLFFDPVGTLAGGWPPKRVEELAAAIDLPMYVNEKAYMMPDQHWCGHLCLAAKMGPSKV